tara:strand:- start:787 stop:1488 length:702 start_codon:yes stop_codon:yes gene_type:complete
MYILGNVYDIFQKRNTRETCFFEPENYRTYLKYMSEVLPLYGNSLHAYCLMTNHVHLLITPCLENSISNLMKVVCSRYAQYINRKYSRTGTLWEGRHKSSAIDSQNYLLKCYRYIELNPVRASMVVRPEEYVWTSYHYNAWGYQDNLISAHETYLALGQKSQEHRCSIYRKLFKKTLSRDDISAIRKSAHYSMPLGSDKFVEQISRKIGKTLGYAARGRPQKELIKNKSLRPL